MEFAGNVPKLEMKLNATFQTLIIISTMEKSTKTSWGLTCTTMGQGIMTLLWVGG